MWEKEVNLFSYVVRYDSGFAPNPFYNFCTLATCKPQIRKSANIGDWIVGIGSADRKILQGGKMVYAMEVAKVISFQEYFNGEEYQRKKPIVNGSRSKARGDNIYHKTKKGWRQLNSFHSNKDGTPNKGHVENDTSVDKVLLGYRYIYFGKDAPNIPEHLESNGKQLANGGRGYCKFSLDDDVKMIMNFFMWYQSFEKNGLVGFPFDWGEGRKES